MGMREKLELSNNYIGCKEYYFILLSTPGKSNYLSVKGE
jgi:hypothetical protein